MKMLILICGVFRVYKASHFCGTSGNGKTPHVMLVEMVQFAVSQGLSRKFTSRRPEREWKEWLKTSD
jgi:hypothetical protein